MKKKIISCLLAMMLVLGLSACGEAPNSTASTASDAKKLTIWAAGTGDPESDKTFRKVLDAYTAEHPEISYELAFVGWNDYFTKLNTALAGGAGPDILMLGYGQMGTVQSMDVLLPLDEYIPESWDGFDDYLPNVLQAGKNDGKLYGLLQPQTRVTFYRKDIAEQNQVTAEDLKVDSYEELRELALKMTVKDESGKIKMSGLASATGKTSAEQQFLVFMNYVTENVKMWNEDLTPYFNSPDGIKTMETIISLYNEGVSLPSQPSAITPGIVDGTAAMCGGSENVFVQANLAFPGQIGIVDSSLGSMLSGNFFAVNKMTKYPKESAEMLLHMFSKESCLEFSNGMGLYSGRASLDDEYTALNPEEFGKIVKTFTKAKPMGPVMNPYYNKMVALFRSASEEIFAGADTAKTLQRAADEYMAAMNK